MPMQEINELKDSFVDNLLPLKIYLFGSMAEGKGNEDSDFDFYIVVDDSQKICSHLQQKLIRQYVLNKKEQ